jgi:hypothetical protein
VLDGKGVGAMHSESALKRWLRDPERDRPAHMPKLDLSDAQITALAAFLAALE